MHQPSVERKLTILDDDLKNRNDPKLKNSLKREDDSKSEDMTRKVMTSFNVFKVFFSLQYVWKAYKILANFQTKYSAEI